MAITAPVSGLVETYGLYRLAPLAVALDQIIAILLDFGPTISKILVRKGLIGGR